MNNQPSLAGIAAQNEVFMYSPLWHAIHNRKLRNSPEVIDVDLLSPSVVQLAYTCEKQQSELRKEKKQHQPLHIQDLREELLIHLLITGNYLLSNLQTKLQIPSDASIIKEKQASLKQKFVNAREKLSNRSACAGDFERAKSELTKYINELDEQIIGQQTKQKIEDENTHSTKKPLGLKPT